MRLIKTVKAMESPARDLPEGVVLTVDKDLSADVADALVRDGYAVEHIKEPAAPAPAPEPVAEALVAGSAPETSLESEPEVTIPKTTSSRGKGRR